MADVFLILPDLRRISANLIAAGDPMDEAAVRDWLIGQGMIPRPDGWWVCEEIQLGLFGDGEILMQREMT
jgi:hypothetical protein